MRPSTTTELAKRLPRSALPAAASERSGTTRGGTTRGNALLRGALLTTLCTVLLTAPACTATVSHGRLVPGEPVAVDLDGDGSAERVEVDPADDSLTIADGSVFYRSRDRWQVVQAVLGDTDRDGLTEIIALLDSETGRHIGLFAFFGGSYRERLVTQAIVPAPSAIEVVTEGADMLVLFQPAGAVAPRETLLRWNGFGYTRVEVSSDASL